MTTRAEGTDPEEPLGTALAAMPAALLEYVVALLPHLSWSSDELAQHQRAALREVLAFAREASPWHRDRLAGIATDDLDPGDLSPLPTMTKRELMVHWDEVVTDRRLTLDAARRHLEAVDAGGLSLLLGEYLVFQSGGSTGEPGVFCWHDDDMARWGASVVRWAVAAGHGPPGSTAWVGARSLRHPSAAVTILNGGDPRLIVPVDQPLADVVARLNDLQAEAVMVVGSMLGPLVDAARRGELRIRPQRMGVFGDVVDRRAMIDSVDVFGVAPTEGYPTTDVGHIGQQSPGEPGVYLNEDLLLVECVDEHERPVPAGVLCDHLLVTSLHQRTLPMIRYRVDDRVVVDPEPGAHAAFRRLSAIDGRSDDVFRYDGVTVHPHTFRSEMSRLTNVRDYQVCQTPSGAEVAVVGDVDEEHLARDLRRALERAGLREPQVGVRRVEELPRSAVGKRRNFVPC